MEVYKGTNRIMEIKDFNEFKEYLLSHIQIDDTDRPLDGIYNIEYMISKKLSIDPGAWASTEEYRQWKSNEQEFLKSMINTMTWLIENMDQQ